MACSELDQGGDLITFEALPPVQISQLDQETDAHDRHAESADEVQGGNDRAPGSQDIIDHQHPPAPLQRIEVNLESILPVFQEVFASKGPCGKLPWLAYGDEAGAKFVGHGRPDDEAAGFRTHYHVNPPVAVNGGQ
jgi:hypothetical protein